MGKKMKLTESNLKSIYGTITNIQDECVSSELCWQGIDKYKTHQPQTPYFPYIGKKYKGILFCGINLNGGFENLRVIHELVKEAVNDYLRNHRYKIFKSETYGGSPFYYYVPLLSFLYQQLYYEGISYNNEEEITWDQIIEGFEFCGLTNLIKCCINSPNNRSQPSDEMFKNCIPKLIKELDHISYKVIFTFSYKKYPNLVELYFKDYKTVIQKNQFRILNNQKQWIVEVGHPLSMITRQEKFRYYNEAIHYLVKYIRT